MDSRLKQIALIGTLVCVSYLVLAFAGYLFFINFLVSDNKSFIETIESRIVNSLTYKEGKWDTGLYNSDPLTPYPNASTTFPIYIITKDGYVVERSKPISGFLDTSDYKHLIQFSEPTTISTVVNESWRVFSQKITDNNEEIGVIIIAYYNPEPTILEQIDSQLQKNMERIVAQTSVADDKLELTNFDERKVDYNLSFQIVSKSNRVLWNNGRTPTFIDPSYLETELNETGFHTITDNRTGENYLVKSLPIHSEDKSVVGLIAVGKSTLYIEKLQESYLWTTFVVGVIYVLGLTYLIYLLANYYAEQKLKAFVELEKHAKVPTQKLVFDAKKSMLIVDGNKVPIVYASNQYYLCKALFTKPQKRWENDELLDLFGEEINESNYKKVYDTAIALNKKLGFHLIIYKDRMFNLNPEFLAIVTKLQ